MPILSLGALAGFALTLLVFTALGVYALRMVRTSQDFTVGGRRAGWQLIAGAIVGSLVGGSSTIGTAQLAYTSGLDAWWVTLGAGIGALLLGLLAPRLQRSGLITVPQFLARNYGQSIAPVSSILSTVAIFLSIIAQGLAAVALLTTVFPISETVAALLAVALVVVYVSFGGLWGAGLLGQLKLLLLVVSFLACGVLAYSLFGGWAGLERSFPPLPWLSLFGRGVGKDLAIGLSLVVGVLSTQTYVQVIFAGLSPRQARRGALVAAVLIPLFGLGGVLVGLAMRLSHPGMLSSTVLPAFVLEYFPAALGGVILATLLITIIGGWAGLTLGVSTMLGEDIYRHYLRPRASDREVLRVERLLVLAQCVLTMLLVSRSLDSLIVDWYVLSLGLRGATNLFPFLGAIFLPGRVARQAGLAAVLLGPLVVVLWYYLGPGAVDPLYPGLAASLLAMLVGVWLQARRKAAPGQTPAS